MGSNDIVDCSPFVMLVVFFSSHCLVMLVLVLYQQICNDRTASLSLVALHVRLVLLPSTAVLELLM